MPLSFLVPAFLAGLAALAVPVLIHLMRRQPDRAVEFPSLMFIRQIPHRTTQRRKVRNWLLLALRCAALAIIALAFARPFFDRPVAMASPLVGGREVVILLDRSYSMGYGDRWERAREAASAAVDGLGNADRATLVFFDAQPEAVTRSTNDRGLLRSALGDAGPGSGGTRLAPALKLAESVLAGSALPRREVVLISDFQKTGWEARMGESRVQLPSGTVVTPISVADAAAANLAVAGVGLEREMYQGRERVTATARLVNKSDRSFDDVPVVLELGGRPVERRSVSVAPNAAVAVEFSPFTLSQPNTRGAVTAGADDLPADNRFHFVVSPGEAIPVLVLEGSSVRGDASLYLSRALQIGAEPGFRVTVRRSAELQAADLAGSSVVVLNDAVAPGGEMGRRLRSFVESGGGVLTLAGAGAGGELDGLLPAPSARPVERMDDGGAALGYLDFSHPIFETFNTPRGGDFAAARFFGYRPLATRDADRTLARFGDGSAALVERRAGRGRVLAWASTLDNSWNDLALQPVFLPFVHQLVSYAAGYAPPEPFVSAGQVLDASRYPAGEGERFALTPGGERVAFGDSTPLVLREQGVYELRSGRSGGALAGAVAVNLDPSEADLTPLDPAELVSAVTTPGGSEQAPGLGAEVTEAERERSQTVWWYLLIGAFVLLVGETMLSNRLARAVR